jgi:hypothetical protein
LDSKGFLRDDWGSVLLFWRRGRGMTRLFQDKQGYEVEFLLFYDDLKEETQKRLCETFKTTPEKENWGMVPVITLKKVIEK